MGVKISVLIVNSNEDPAGTNIRKSLLELSNWDEIGRFKKNPVYENTNIDDIKIVTINDRTIRHENLESEVKKELNINPNLVIFITRHRSKTGEPSLTAHPIGNYGEAKFGGKNKTLTKAAPRLMTHLIRTINKNAKLVKTYHQVCFEVTHHGPYLETPTLFTEVGSNLEEWNKKKPAKIVAKSVLEVLEKFRSEKDMPKDIPVFIGIGGGHYAPRFTDVALNKKSAFGHMIPTYQIREGNIDYDIIKEAIDKTPNFKGIYIHKKSLKKSKVTEYKNLFEKNDIPVISSKELEDL